MEGGGLEFSPESQDQYIGDIIGRDYYPLDSARLRYFGGTSGHWGGRCRGLEPWDFGAKAFIPCSEWPISKAYLEPYAAETEETLDIPSADVFPDSTDSFAGKDIRVIRFRHSAPTGFGEKYRDPLANSQRISRC